MSKRLAKKVLLIGWDAADWKIIDPLIEQGLMPALESMINKGVMGNIATLDPPLSPMLWTSIATGKTADKHGILGFVEPVPNELKIRPVSSTSRKVKAIWNILTQKDLKTHTVAWWPTHPAEPINGICVSDMYGKVVDNMDKPWPMPARSIHPEELKEIFAELRVHPEELTAAHILPFIPLAEKIDQDKDRGIQVFAKMLAETASIQSAATWILENKEWDFAGFYFNSLDHFCHTFMKFHPPQIPGTPDDMFEKYKDVVTNVYRFYDMMLERLLKLAGDDTTVILVSDHGFYSDHLRLRKTPDEPAGPASEHRPYGIFCMKGPAVKEDERIYGASILDITPTLLTLFGLPCGKDMDGKVLTQAFKENIVPEYIPSWEDVAGASGMHPPEMQNDPWASQEAMQQLIELGYVEKPGEETEKSLKKLSLEAQHYLAKVYMGKREFAKALPLLERSHTGSPEILRYAISLALCYQNLGRNNACRKVIEEVKKHHSVDLPSVQFLEGMLLLSENKPLKALEWFKKIEIKRPNQIDLLIHTGNAYLKLRQWKNAETIFKKALAVQEENAAAHHGLAIAYLRTGQTWEAVDEALSAVGLLHFFPAAHYVLGEALLKTGEFETATKAFEMCISQTPGSKKAHQWLAKIYSEKIPDPAKAKFHLDFIEKNIAGTIRIVSGLPRSGTSMMMNMLKSGGVDILTDDLRKADESNPAGYFEYEKVKRLQTDKSWLAEAKDKVIKVVAPQLFHLPENFSYKIIFMQRNMEEVMLSQQTMLKKEKTYNVSLAEAFNKLQEQSKVWIESQPNAEVLYVSYTDVISHPEENAQNIAAFLDDELDQEKMIAAVNKDLYRNRIKNSEI